MSYWSDLYAGDPRLIAAALNDDDGDIDDAPFVKASANLPGILPGPENIAFRQTMDTLTRVACEMRGIPNLLFMNQLAEQIGGDPDPNRSSSGTFVMSADWVALMAGRTDRDVATVIARWMEQFVPRPLPDAAAGFGESAAGIVQVCRTATAQALPVVYFWTL